MISQLASVKKVRYILKLSEYAKQRGITISLTVVARIECYTKVGLNKVYEDGRIELLDRILDDAQRRFDSIVRDSKLK